LAVNFLFPNDAGARFIIQHGMHCVGEGQGVVWFREKKTAEDLKNYSDQEYLHANCVQVLFLT
jgi:hypothetical protein